MVGVPHLTGKQKLYTALVSLVCESGGVEQRMRSAFRSTIASIDPQLDIPPELAGEFTRLRDEMHREFVSPSNHRSGPERRQWAATMATRIVAFYDSLARIK